MIKTFKYRLYPTKEQVEKLEWTLSRCCELYNATLQERKDAWNACKNHPNYYDLQTRKELAKEYTVNFAEQCRSLTVIRNEVRQEYQQIGSHVLQNVLHRVDKAFANFFRRVTCGQALPSRSPDAQRSHDNGVGDRNRKAPGYPRYQSYKRYDSFCFPDQAGWKLIDNRLSITGIGTIKVKMHREIQGTIKTTTIKREGQYWYGTFACEREAQSKLPYTEDAIGIDLGLLHFATLSTGDMIENPRYYRKGEKKLKKAQEELSRKKRGSNRRKKAVQRVAKAHRKIRNQRNDFLHKQSAQLVQTYETIVFEDLQPKNMSRKPKAKQDTSAPRDEREALDASSPSDDAKRRRECVVSDGIQSAKNASFPAGIRRQDGNYLPNGASAKAGLNKSVLDAGWRTFIAMCESKAANAGTTQVIRVNPKDTSQVCSACLKKGPHKDLSERTHTCVHCGVVLDRDHNASLNILRLGRSHQAAHVA